MTKNLIFTKPNRPFLPIIESRGNIQAMDFFQKIAKWIIAGGTVLLALSPFFVSAQTAFPAVFLRVIMDRIAIEVMFVVWLFLAMFFPQYRPKRSVIAYAVGVFMLAFLFSTIFGINPFRAFWGSHERMEGYVTLLHFGAFFLILYSTFKKPEEFKKVLWAAIIVSVAQCFYAFGQLPGINIESTKLFANDTSRISGTFGNATIFALYLIFQAFFALMLFFWENAAWKRRLCLAIFAMDFLGIYFSGTRGALLGSIMGLILMGFGYALFAGSKKMRMTGITLLVLVIGSWSMLWIFHKSDFVSKNYLLSRAAIFTSAKETMVSRSTAWKIGLSAWKDRFWFGFGMDNFNYAFNHYYDPWMYYYDSGDFDRPHNRFVESIVTGGFFGIAAHLSVFVAAAWFLLSKWRKNKSFLFPLAALSLLGAYAIELSTLFDHMISYQFFAIFLALLAVWQRQESSASAIEETSQHRATPIFNPAYENLKFAVLAAAAIGMSVFMWTTNIKPAQASYWAQVASNTNYVSGGKDFKAAFEALQKSFDLNTYLNVDMRLALSGFAISQATGATTTDEDKQFARQVLEYMAGQFEKNLTEHHPDIKDFLSHTTYARICQALAKYDSSWNNKALATLQQAVDEYPAKAQVLLALGRMYMQMGDPESAAKLYDAHPLTFAPGSYYFDYAAALYSTSRNDDAWTQIKNAMEHNNDFKSNLGKLVDVLLKDNRYDRIIELYEYQLANAQAGDTQLMASLAQTYKQTGDITNARRVAEQLLEADPSHVTDTQEFLKSLEKK
jgi:O-antigen ligase/tetratricopeptide (TPR) repeat protein